MVEPICFAFSLCTFVLMLHKKIIIKIQYNVNNQTKQFLIAISQEGNSKPTIKPKPS